MLQRTLTILPLLLLLLMGGPIASLEAHVAPAGAFTVITDQWRPDPAVAELRLVGTRGGQASAQAVALVGGPLTVTASELTGADGARLPASTIQVRYGWNREPHATATGLRRQFGDYRILAPRSDPEASRTPIWLTAHIPADAVPGDYRGELTVSHAEGRTTLPLRLEVGAWRLPASRDFASIVGLLYSPDSVALRYDVQPWSPEHLRLLEPSLDHLAQVGQDVFYVPFIVGSRTHFGTVTPLVRFVREGDSLRPDFTGLDRFAALWRERVGAPRFAVLYLWCSNLSDGTHGPAERVDIQVFDPDTGAVETRSVPYFGAPGSEEIWRPAVEGAIARLRALEFPDDSILLGIGQDKKPHRRELDAMRKMFPGRKWNVISHSRGYGLPRQPEPVPGLTIAYHEVPWGPHMPEQLRDGLLRGWNLPYARVSLSRFHFGGAGGNQRGTPIGYALVGDGSIADYGHGNFRPTVGFSRFKADFLAVPQTDFKGQVRLGGLLQMGGWVNLMRNHQDLLMAGVDGAVATVHFQHLVEGIHATEARIAIEKALTDTARKEHIPEHLAEEARSIIAWRAALILRLRQEQLQDLSTDNQTAYFNRLRRLYDLAAAFEEMPAPSDEER
ncbi:MAG: hypothetical protein JJU36_14685 [Phycisphaeraceae bacterium]|nr:hypothetical protein [Phycisphaeraceae bacterium]